MHLIDDLKLEKREYEFVLRTRGDEYNKNIQ